MIYLKEDHMKSEKILISYFQLSEKERKERYLPKTSVDCLKKGQIAVGSAHIALLNEDGSVSARGNNDFGQCNVNQWKDIVKIAAGDFHTVALKKDGTVLAAGDNAYGQCNVSRWKGVTDLFAEKNITIAVHKSGGILMAVKAPNAATQAAEEAKKQKRQADAIAAAVAEAVEQKLQQTVVKAVVTPPDQPKKPVDTPKPTPTPTPQEEKTPVKKQTEKKRETIFNNIANSTPAGEFNYTIINGCVTIQGYKGGRKEIVIPETIHGKPVTVIDSHAFEGNDQIKQLTLPRNLIHISRFAFRSCSNLMFLEFPEESKLERIGECAFEKCTALKGMVRADISDRIVLPNGVQTIERWAFSQCSELKNVVIPDSVLSIGFSAFGECPALKSIHITQSTQERLGRLDLITDNINVINK